MISTLPRYGDLANACTEWAKIPLTDLKPRRDLNLSDKMMDWRESLTALKHFAASEGYTKPFDLEDYAALENCMHWQAAGENAYWLLIYGIDLGLSGDLLRAVYLETVALWRDYTTVASHARDCMHDKTGDGYDIGPPINTHSSSYRTAVTLLALATLLDAQDEVPAVVEDVLALDTDQLLDYLSAGALQLEEVSEELFHQRPYGAMRPFFEQVSEALPDPLVPYLQTQYTNFFKLSPKQQKKGGQWLGTGSWALEVAALAVLYGWDDAALRSCPHYPADLVDYARSRGETEPIRS
ncbi:MAG: DUF1911 domain-containing protein [Comamonas sp.]